jgi:hypothetical protein
MNGDNGRSAVAELMAAISALKIAENLLVDDITDFGAGHGTSCTTEQATEDGSGETAEQHAGRTADCAYSSAGLSSGQSTSGAGCCTTNSADRATDPSGSVEAMNICRMADGTFVTHDFFSWK